MTKVTTKGGQQIEVSPEEAQLAYQRGNADFAGPVQLVRGNEAGEVDAADLPTALAQGWEVASSEDQRAAKVRGENQGLAGDVRGGGEALLRGATLGFSDPALRALGVDAEGLDVRKKQIGGGATALELLGTAAPSLLSGGVGAVGKVSRFTPAGAVERAGLAAARGTEGLTGSRIAGMAVQGAVEGGIGGMGAAASVEALADRDLSAERILAGGVEGLGIGGALGMGFGVAGRGLSRGVDAAGQIGQAGLKRVSRAAGGVGDDLSSLPRLEGAAKTLGRVLGSGDPDAFARSVGRLRTPEGRSRLLSNIDEARETSARSIKSAVDEANSAVDDAVRLTQGRGKLRRVEELMSGVDNATAGPRAVDHIRQQQRAIQDALAEAGDAISPELRRDLRKADRLATKAFDEAAKGKTGAAAFRAIDNFKREIDQIAKGRSAQYKRGAAPEIQEAADLLRGIAKQSRSHLEDEGTYGAAALMQREINGAASAEFQALEELRKASPQLRKMLERGAEADTQAALAMARASGKAGGGTKVGAVDRVLDARMEYLRTVRKHHDLPPEAAKKIDAAEASIEKMRAQLRDQSETAAALDDAWKLREAEGNKSPSITALSSIGPSVGGLIGMGFGGPLGAAAGAALGSLTRPYSLLRGAAGVLNQFDGLARWGRGVDDVARKETSIAQSLERLADGGRGAVRMAGAAARRAAIQGAVRESQEQRKSRLLEVRSTVLASGTNPMAVAEAFDGNMGDLQDVAPDLARAIVERSSVAVQFLASKAPDVYEPEFGPNVQVVDPAELDRFDRYVAAVTDPLGAISKISRGALDMEAAETLRVVYPKMYAEFQGKVLDMLGKRKQAGIPTSYEARVQLGLLLDMPLDDSLKPGFLAAFNQPPPQEPQAPMDSGGSEPYEVTGVRTDLNRLETGQLRA